MKKRYFALGYALLASSLLVMALGAFLKYSLLRDVPMVQDKAAAELPFVLLSDAGLRYGLQMQLQGQEEPVEPSAAQTVPTQMETTPVTQMPTEQATEAATHPATEPATQPSVEPTVPLTEPNETQIALNTLPEEETVAATEPIYDDPDFSQGGVELSWYDDALFIGNSRTVGLRDYARAGNARYYCSVGMTVFDYDEWYVPDGAHPEMNIHEILAERLYGKVLISLGINECGYPLESILGAYSEMIAVIQAAQPSAKIILQGILTTGRMKAEEADYFTPGHLAGLNEGIASLADGKTIFYIDFNPVIADEEGYLPEHMSWDGCHLYAKYLGIWADWIGVKMKELGI